MKHIESRIQKSCVRWFRLNYPELAGNLFSIPNGGKRNQVTAANLKAEGALAGVSDLFLAVPNDKAHGLFVEMKAPGGRLTEKQIIFKENVMDEGYAFAVCHSFDEFEQAVTKYLTLTAKKTILRPVSDTFSVNEYKSFAKYKSSLKRM